MVQGIKKSVFSVLIVPQLSHLFCCVLPAVFSILGLLFGLGMLPAWVSGLHDVVHDWELHIMGFSALMLALGWGMLYFACQESCEEGACGHSPHHQKNSLSFKILIAASVLFFTNLSVYLLVHHDSHGHEADTEHSHSHASDHYH